MKLTGENRSTRGKTFPSATLPTTNPLWTDPRSNPDLLGGRPATNRLSHGTVLIIHTFGFKYGIIIIIIIIIAITIL
jgi:hypothetical protein